MGLRAAAASSSSSTAVSTIANNSSNNNRRRTTTSSIHEFGRQARNSSLESALDENKSSNSVSHDLNSVKINQDITTTSNSIGSSINTRSHSRNSLRSNSLDNIRITGDRGELVEWYTVRQSSPNVSGYSEMAPALTEPLSQTSKLSSSTTSASPRPSSNSHLTNNTNNNTSSNHNSSNLSNNINSINNNNNSINSVSGRDIVTSNSYLFGGGKVSTTTASKRSNTVDFQQAFEEVIAKQAAAAAAARQKRLQVSGNTTGAAGTAQTAATGNSAGEQNPDTESNVEKTITPSLHLPQNQLNNNSKCNNNNNNNSSNIKNSNSSNTLAAFSSDGPRSNYQMGPMCDTNTTAASLLNLDEKKNQLIISKDQQQRDQRIGGHMDSSDSSSTISTKAITTTAELLHEDEHNIIVPQLTEITSPSDDSSSQQIVDDISSSATGRSVDQQTLHEDIEEKIPGTQVVTTVENVIVTTQDVNQSGHQVDSGDTSTLLSRAHPGLSTPTSTVVETLSQGTQSQQDQQQLTPTNSSVTLTPHCTPITMGLQKDFIKDSAEMEQVLGEFATTEMDLLQVLKGLESTPGSEAALCDLAGSLGLFNDVDVMNYEEICTPAKDSETKEIRLEIEKRQHQMHRKCDYLLRRLRKLQARYMGKHTSEEITGLFEWTNRIVRRKDHERARQLSYEDEKHRSVSATSMKTFLRRLDTAATSQHSTVSKRNKVGRPPSTSLLVDASGSSAASMANQSKTLQPAMNSLVPAFDDKTTADIEHVSGMLQTELKEVQSALDSDVTASSSGGESADEMVTYNNQMQQSLSIAKRAAWRWARDRSSIASRWTWLLAQISDLEYRIKQHNELHHQIKKNKGSVSFEKYTSSLTTAASTSTAATAATASTSTSASCGVLSSLNPTLTSSVNGYRGVLPGNSKPMEVDAAVPPNGAYDASCGGSTTAAVGSCRTRPFQRGGFRKRKLLQTANVHTISKKAARPSTVKCGCQWPLHPCALCTGRSDPTAPRDLPDTMPLSERVALLDPGYHPVLSFPEDISNSIHFEATVRLPEWQNRVIRCSTKAALKGALAAQKAAEREDRLNKKYLDNRRSNKHSRKNAQDIAANKLKNAKNRRAQLTHLVKNKHRKLVSSNGGGGGSGSGNTSTGNGGTHQANSNCGAYGESLLGDNLDGTNGFVPRSKNSSPAPGSNSGSSSYKNERFDRRSRNSYDIDNIVIPYSVAAATRVEILQYKEIPTPKWRIVDDEIQQDDDGISKKDDFEETKHVEQLSSPTTTEVMNNCEDESEDISFDSIQVRHERALLEERRKFQTYLKFPWSTRSRANRRIDSRAESSGANTPDPTSPAPNTPSVGGDQESIPSPAAPSTPLTPLDNPEGADSVTTNNQSSGTIAIPINPPNNLITTSLAAARRAERKRTVSIKKDREHQSNREEHQRRSNTPDLRETFPPFEPLQFPLSDDLYEAMLQMMPNDHQLLEDCLKTTCDNATADSGGDGGGEHQEADADAGGSEIECGKLEVSESDDMQSAMETDIETLIPAPAIIVPSALGIGKISKLHQIHRHNPVHPTCMHNDSCGTELTITSTGGFDAVDTLMDVDSDTESIDSAVPDDPNDPEWCEPA